MRSSCNVSSSCPRNSFRPPPPLSTYNQLPVWEVDDDNEDDADDADDDVLLIPQTWL